MVNIDRYNGYIKTARGRGAHRNYGGTISRGRPFRLTRVCRCFRLRSLFVNGAQFSSPTR